jgi:hypothetical protein
MEAPPFSGGRLLLCSPIDGMREISEWNEEFPAIVRHCAAEPVLGRRAFDDRLQ